VQPSFVPVAKKEPALDVLQAAELRQSFGDEIFQTTGNMPNIDLVVQPIGGIDAVFQCRSPISSS
jgi:hypothetical protein